MGSASSQASTETSSNKMDESYSDNYGDYGGGGYGGHHHATNAEASRIGTKDDSKPLVAVVVTFSSGSSYDDLFRSVSQETPEGSVSVFHLNHFAIEALLKKLKRSSLPDNLSATFTSILNEIVDEIGKVDPDSVVFNFECCAGLSSYHFNNKDHVMELLKLVIERKHMVMFSDFALKALINDWSSDHLGPKPFNWFGDFSGSLEIKFDPAVLRESPSAQLQKVGELVENGEATLHAMGSTIAFTVDAAATDTSAYKLQVLTVATKLGDLNMDQVRGKECKINNHVGAAGHVLLTYPSGGTLLCSCGHWIELVKLDVSMENLIRVATKEYGNGYSNQISEELSKLSGAEQMERVQGYAREFVQKSAPCKYSKKMS